MIPELFRSAQTSRRSSLSSSEDLVEAFERMYTQRNCLNLSCNGDAHSASSLLLDGSWFDVVFHDNSSWGFLFFQRPDCKIQPCLIPRTSYRKAIILEPLDFNATARSPLCCIRESLDSGEVILRLFFLRERDTGQSMLAECTLSFSKKELFQWTDMDVSLPFPVIPIPQSFPFITKIEGKLFITGTTTSNHLSRLGKEADGSWKNVSFPAEIPVSQGDHLFHTFGDFGDTLRLRTVNQNETVWYEFTGCKKFIGIGSCQAKDLDVEKKNLNWHGHSLSLDLPSIVSIEGKYQTAAGVLCRTTDNKVYYFQGHPWWDEFQSPKLICEVKEKSTFLVSRTSNDFLYLSAENEMMRIKFTVGEDDEIKFGRPWPVFPESLLTSTLNELSLPGPLDSYISSESLSSWTNRIWAVFR